MKCKLGMHAHELYTVYFSVFTNKKITGTVSDERETHSPGATINAKAQRWL